MKPAYLRLLAAGAIAVVLAACSAPPGSPAPNGPASVSQPSADPDERPFTVTEATAFDEPWAMAFLPGTDYLAITERSGRLHLRDQTTGQLIEVTGVPEVVHAGQGGLGDVMPGPRFEEDSNLYLTWAEAGPDGTSGAVLGRAQLVIEGNQARLEGLTKIWQQEPFVVGDGHFAHRITFSPGGAYLYLTSGERQQMAPAQDLGTNLGKIVRLTPDGTPAAGNPFADRGGVSTQIWSYGHRNPLGIAFALDGRLWISEMGPEGGDEINLIEPGRNYGWPNASNGSHYGGDPIPDHAPGDGYAAPKVWWTPSVSPGSLMIYDGALFRNWRGNAFLGALSGESLIRVVIRGNTATKADRWAMGARIREVEQGPDGSIWLLEDAGSGRLLQLTPTD